MLSTAQSVAVTVISVVLVLGALLLLRQVRGPTTRRAPEDVVSWHVGLLGTTYAVILAFMLSGVWADFQTAEANAAVEATALVNLFRLADGLPAPQRAQVRALCRDYANLMVTEEWPAMSHDSLSPAGFRVTQQLWTTVLQADARSPAEQTSMQQAIETLGRMTEHRRVRQLQSRSRLPGILWAVLIVGGLVTVGSSCTFEARSLRLHAFQVVTLSLLITSVLLAIADIDRPFQGAVHVSPDGFTFARATFDQLTPATR